MGLTLADFRLVEIVDQAFALIWEGPEDLLILVYYPGGGSWYAQVDDGIGPWDVQEVFATPRTAILGAIEAINRLPPAEPCSPSDPAADEDGDGLINGQDCAPCDATRGPSEDCA